MEAPRLSPYSHSSLGKFILDYRHDNKGGHKLSPRGARGRDLTLSIPESELTWRGGSRSSGTQMLVFRASQFSGVGRDGKKTRVSQRFSSSSLSSSKKTNSRKRVALELNRINPASLAKFQSPSANGSPANQNQVIGDSVSSKGGGGTDSQSSSRRNSTSSMESFAVSGPKLNGHGSTRTGASRVGSRSSSRLNPSDCKSSEQQMVVDDNDSLDSDVDYNLGSSQTQFVTRREKPVTKEIGVMTDLCGIDSVLDLSPVVSKPTETNGRKSSSHLRLSLHPSPSLTKGCTDRCTSPGFPAPKDRTVKNGTFNGFTFNGYANPNVLKLRTEPEAYQRNRKKALSLLQRHVDQHAMALLSTERNGRHELRDEVVTHKDPETGEIRPCSELQGTAPTRDAVGGGRGREVPFTISIPRMMLSPTSENQPDSMGGVNESLNAREGDDTCTEVGAAIDKDGIENDEERQSGNVSTQQKGISTTPSSSYKRRSEIQLLLDGDKPPSERIRANEVPMFTAEDLASRTSPHKIGGSGGGQLVNKPWLDSSTRKITPVEHFDYSFVSLTQKVTGMASNSSSGCAGSGGVGAGSANSTIGSRKRNISDSDVPVGQCSGSAVVLPPSKQPKLSGSACNSVITEDREDETILSTDEFSDRGDVLSPTQDASNTLLTTNEVVGHDTNIGLDSGGLPGKGSAHNDSPFHSDDVFASEIVVFDSRGDCLLQEGEYSILMQQCTKKETGIEEESPELLTFPPLTWSSVFGGGASSKVR